MIFFFSSRRRHTRFDCDWSSDVCSSDLGAIAVVLASFGLFGLMSYNVRAQRNELGIRIALGATAPMILRMVLGRALLLTASGIAIGTGAALLVSRLLSNLIFGAGSLALTAYVLSATALL